MLNMKSLSLTVQKLWPRLKFFWPQSHRQTERTKTRCPRIPFQGHKNINEVAIITEPIVKTWQSLDENPIYAFSHYDLYLLLTQKSLGILLFMPLEWNL